jgi:predicted PurR-regulated permease PerM
MAQADNASKPPRFFALASLGLFIIGLYLARDVLIPIAVALLLTFLLTPLVHRLEHFRVPRIPAVLISVTLSFVVIGSIAWLISDQATDLAVKIGSYQGDIEKKIKKIHGYFGHGAIADASRAIDKMAQDVAASQPSNRGDSNWLTRGTPQNPVSVSFTSSPEPTNALKSLEDALSIIEPLAQSLIVIVFVIFMLIQREDIRDRLIRLVGHGRLTVTTRALDDASTRISRYLLAQSAINGVYGIVVGVGLYFIRIPNAPLWGLLCALLRFIPYLGIWIGATFPIILSLVVPEGAYAARPFLTIGLFAATELIAANVVEPVMFSSSTGVSPLAILVAAVFWTWLWGGIGLLLSTPLTVLLAVAGKYVPQLEFLDVLLGDQPVLSLPERYYQRLLADDPEEAEDLLEEAEKTKSADQIYSEIILPALQMTERDHHRGVLDDQTRNFIAQLIREQVEALYQEGGKKDAVEEAAAAAAGEAKATVAIPRGAVIRVACLPAQSIADEVAGLMLVNMLNKQGYTASLVSSEALSTERVEAIATLNADMVVISSLPPGAFVHARYLYKRIRGKYPELPIVIGVWNVQEKTEQLSKRLAGDPAIKIVTLFSDAMATLGQFAQPILMRASEEAPASAEAQHLPAAVN